MLRNFKGLTHFKTASWKPRHRRCFSGDKLDQIDEEAEESSESDYEEIPLLPRSSSFPRLSKEKEIDITFKNFCDKLRFDILNRKKDNNVYAERKQEIPVIIVEPPKMVSWIT